MLKSCDRQSVVAPSHRPSVGLADVDTLFTAVAQNLTACERAGGRKNSSGSITVGGVLG